MKRLIYLLILLIFGISACNSTRNNKDDQAKVSPTTPSLAQLLEDGETTYTTYCAACHGVDGEGQNPEDPYAPDENGRYMAPPHNENGHTWHHGDDVLNQIINEGGMGDTQFFNEMPAFGEMLSDNQIEAVLTYIKSFWTEEQRTTQKERTEAVRNQ